VFEFPTIIVSREFISGWFLIFTAIQVDQFSWRQNEGRREEWRGLRRSVRNESIGSEAATKQTPDKEGETTCQEESCKSTGMNLSTDDHVSAL